MVARGFRDWCLFNKGKREEEIIKKKSQKKINEIQQELVQTMKKIENINIKEGELNSEITQAKRKINDSSKYIKDLEERDIHLNNEYISLLEKSNSGTSERVNVKELDDRVHLLEGQINEVEDENKLIKEKLEGTNTNVGSFIREMSTLLDSHEL